jgi:BirA family biotin operon repressor/biotin-[acetyl-CoA-carboxylase] ligase
MSTESLDPVSLSEVSPWGVPVRVVEETTSSNDELLREGENGAPAGTMLFAEFQAAGRGQFRRPWSSARGLGLWFSLLLRTEASDRTIPLLSAFAAVALVETIHGAGISDFGIKPPNDVMIGGRKVAGILVETRTGRNPFAVVGIGLNVNHSAEDFPEEIRERAVSLAMAAGALIDRNAVAASLIVELGKAERVMRESPGDLLASWHRELIPDEKITAFQRE